MIFSENRYPLFRIHALVDQPQFHPARSFFPESFRVKLSKAVVFVLEILKGAMQVGRGLSHLASYLTAFV